MNIRVKKICKERGITIGELADRMQMVKESLSRAINGNPIIGTSEKIASSLDVPFTELFTTNNQEICGYVEYKGIV
ncbi:helix-turn-helix domain-containing protein [Parabacteroides pacaensis]|uniref:helix-turn-helix domain-containing protein n=1 Tax=Parabacteroides pacaensis TaxID=2086575 RepID=UPI000D10F5F7|nr:helix-turn-helix transcriptional regulator [Parabacteroides pacaensis]